MTDKEKMIEIAKKAYRQYRVVYNDRSSLFRDFEFTFNNYFFYMRMLGEVYPELDRKSLELEWESEIGEWEG